jgi:hypothetical protein
MLVRLSLAMLCLTTALPAAPVDRLLEQIKGVGGQGEGHAAAHQAVRQLSAGDVDSLLPILNASNDANPLAVNWLRGAFEAIASRALRSGGTLPQQELEAFVRDTDNAPRIRRLAYEWLVKVDPEAPNRMIPGMLDDPSPEMRRDAVARIIDAARQAESAGEPDAAGKTWRTALANAVDRDQVDTIAAALKEHGEEVSLIEHFGFLMEWRLIGPFDNKDMQGFDVAYPPEEELKFDARYTSSYWGGTDGPVTWKACESQKSDGLVDIAELLHNHKGSVVYAATDFLADRAQPVEFRLSTSNAWKLWLNGELLFAREEYHRGMRFDQYRVPASLRPGRNVIILKVLQNEQEQDWAQDYGFQFRVTDLAGRAVRESADRRAASAP